MVLVIVALWAWRFPALRRADRPEELQAPRTILAEAPSGLVPEA
jgi:hypothetical protein